MPNRSRKKAGSDPVQIARRIVDQATGVSAPDPASAAPKKPAVKKRPVKKAEHKKDPAAVALGRKGGLKGGKARAAKLTKAELSESASKAANARWSKAKAK